MTYRCIYPACPPECCMCNHAVPEPVAIECTCAAKDMPFGRCCKALPPSDDEQGLNPELPA